MLFDSRANHMAQSGPILHFASRQREPFDVFLVVWVQSSFQSRLDSNMDPDGPRGLLRAAAIGPLGDGGSSGTDDSDGPRGLLGRGDPVSVVDHSEDSDGPRGLLRHGPDGPRGLVRAAEPVEPQSDGSDGPRGLVPRKRARKASAKPKGRPRKLPLVPFAAGAESIAEPAPETPRYSLVLQHDAESEMDWIATSSFVRVGDACQIELADALIRKEPSRQETTLETIAAMTDLYMAPRHGQLGATPWKQTS